MNSIPLYKMHEHNEAFLIWHDAIKKNYLKNTGNSLLHFDQHDDMSLPVLRTPVSALKNNKDALQHFTYDELGIGKFIYPAVYSKIFNKVYWVLQLGVSKPKPAKEFVLSTYQNKGKIYMINQARRSDPGSITFIRQDLTIENTINPSQPIILDIDIDYFSNEIYQNKQIPLEIIKRQYDEYNSNKYHPLRFTHNCYTKKIGEQYFLVFNQSEYVTIRPNAKVSNSEINKRIDAVGEWLITNQIKPQIIEICRDTYSGYIPDNQREFTEQKILKKLESIYNFQFESFNY